MSEKKKDAEETVEAEETEEETEETDGSTEEEDNWGRMKSLIGETFDERFEAWESKQKTKKTTSSHSQRKAAPERKKGFLSGGFFSGLTDDK